MLRACDGIEALSGMRGYMGRNLAIVSLGVKHPKMVQEFLAVIENYPSVDRLVIDSLNKLLLYSRSDRYYKLRLSDLARQLRRKVGCSLLLHETEDGKRDAATWEASECDGVVNLSFMEYEEKPMRTLTVHKLRYTGFEPGIARELIIDEKGLKCLDNQGIRRDGEK